MSSGSFEEFAYEDGNVSPAGALYRVPTASSVDTNATADNLPGPGRNLGNLIGYLGKALERYLSRQLSQRGVGPESVAEAIRKIRGHNRHSIGEIQAEQADNEDRIKLTKYCKKLFKYSKQVSEHGI